MEYFVLYTGGEPDQKEDWDIFFEDYSQFMVMLKSHTQLKYGLPVNPKSGKIITKDQEFDIKDEINGLDINGFMVLSGDDIESITEILTHHPIIKNGGKIFVSPIKEVSL